VLKKEVDQRSPENKQDTSPHAKRKGGSFLEFSEDPVSVEGKAGRVPNNARQVKLATCKGGLLDHRSKYE
jgi:hypothetical protein